MDRFMVDIYHKSDIVSKGEKLPCVEPTRIGEEHGEEQGDQDGDLIEVGFEGTEVEKCEDRDCRDSTWLKPVGDFYFDCKFSISAKSCSRPAARLAVIKSSMSINGTGMSSSMTLTLLL